MSIDALRDHWQMFGERDPMWAVLTEGSRDRNSWDVDEFLATGRRDVNKHLAVVDELHVPFGRGRALDFGCGAGRLTQAFAEHFDHVDGVDIADSMIDHARQLNRQGDRVTFHVNRQADLSLFDDGSFDLVFSMIVLQHMEPRFALAYVREFVRLLKPGGVALFQAPSAFAKPAPLVLPENAWQAEVTVEDLPGTFAARESATLRVTVRNTSAVEWPGDAELAISAHWRSAENDALVKIGDGRTPIEGAVAPGETRELPLVVTPPNVNGSLVLEVDALQEKTFWFGQRGSQSWRKTVAIAGAEDAVAAGEGADAGTEPWMAMYPIPRAEVTAFVEAAGGEVAYALPDTSAGHAFEGYLYVVTRRRSASTGSAVARLRLALDKVSERDDMLPPLESKRTGRARDAELWVKGKIARATRWATMAQVEHDRAVKTALTEVEAALLTQEAELKRLRAEVERLRGE